MAYLSSLSDNEGVADAPGSSRADGTKPPGVGHVIHEFSGP